MKFRNIITKTITIFILQYLVISGAGYLYTNFWSGPYSNVSTLSMAKDKVEDILSKAESVLGIKSYRGSCVGVDGKRLVGKKCKDLTEFIKKNPIKKIIDEKTRTEGEIVPDGKAPLSGSGLVSGIQVEAWIYPGPPACNAVNELKVRNIHTVKVEYMTLQDNGRLSILTDKNAGCNGFSSANLTTLKSYTREQYLTISGTQTGMSVMAKDNNLRTSFVKDVVGFVNSNSMSGVDIDFEQYSSWTKSDYDGFKDTMNLLGNELHKSGKKLQIDMPPIGNKSMQSHYLFKYEDFNSMPVDQYTIMAYDYQFDYAAGTPVQPTAWMNSIIDWSKSKFNDDSKISIGIPAYGYKGVCNTYGINILTYDQVRSMPGFATAKRDPSSHEMMWRSGNTCYSYADTTTLNYKFSALKARGISQVSVWHLGGNLWFGE